MPDNCMICEKEVERPDMEYVQLGKHFPPDATIERLNPQTGEVEKFSLYRSFYACANCAVKEKLEWYKVNYELGRENNKKLLDQNNLFRTLMMNVETMKAIGEVGETIANRTYINQHRPGWEALPIDTLLLFLDLYQKQAAVFAEILNRKASTEEIQSHLRKKTETSKKTHEARIEKQRIESNGGLKGEYTKDEAKAVKSLMKAMNCTEEKAYELINATVKAAQK